MRPGEAPSDPPATRKVGGHADDGGADLDLDSKLMESAHKASGQLGFVAANEVIGAKVAIRQAVAEHMVSSSQYRSRDRQDGFLRAAPALEARELGVQVAVALAHSTPSSLHECGFQPRGARTGTRGQALSRTLVQTWTHSGPRQQVTGRREAAHVATDLRKDDGRDSAADARNGDQPLDGGLVRSQELFHALLELGNPPRIMSIWSR
jgi:hypothetical protein